MALGNETQRELARNPRLLARGAKDQQNDVAFFKGPKWSRNLATASWRPLDAEPASNGLPGRAGSTPHNGYVPEALPRAAERGH
jgi:hypothetical protein